MPTELNLSGIFSFITQYNFCKSSIFQMLQGKGMKCKLGLLQKKVSFYSMPKLPPFTLKVK